MRGSKRGEVRSNTAPAPKGEEDKPPPGEAGSPSSPCPEVSVYSYQDLNNDDLNRITKFIEALRE